MRALRHVWDAAHRAIIANAGTLVGTAGVTAGLGFVYWWIAARVFPTAAVGLASASIAAMVLLATLSGMGLGTVLIGELPRHRGKGGALLTTALLVAGAAGGALGVLFATVAPYLSGDLEPLARGYSSIGLFALGSAVTSITLVLDQALIGLLRGAVQFWRNAISAVIRLGALALAGIWLAERGGLTIYGTWVIGELTSLAGIAAFAALTGAGGNGFRPEWVVLKGLRRTALAHHALNLALQAPSLALPVVVTAVLSAASNASFYIAWMIGGFAFVGPVALTTVLYAVGAAAPSALPQKVRFTLRLSLVIAALANGVLFIGAGRVLLWFGDAYADQAGWALRILALGAFPLIIKDHYVAVCRISGRVTAAALVSAAGACLALGMAAFGAAIGGLTGLSLGWTAAVCIEAAFMARAVTRAALPPIRTQVGPDTDIVRAPAAATAHAVPCRRRSGEGTVAAREPAQ